MDGPDNLACNFTSDPADTARRPFKPPSSKRQQLIPEEAAEIYLQRPSKEGKLSRHGGMALCKVIAPKYGVTPKTIRDIWRGRTWIQATQHLWTEEERAVRLKSQGTTESSDSDELAKTQDEAIQENNRETDAKCNFAPISLLARSQLLAPPPVDQKRENTSGWAWECGSAPLGCTAEDPFHGDW